MSTKSNREVFVKKNVQQERQWAVKRLFDGEHVDSICVSFGRSRAWLYKWAERSVQNDPEWYKSQSRQPHSSPLRTSAEIEEIVKIVRLNLYNRDLFCGDQAIHWELAEMGVKPLPSLRTINRILDRQGLTHRRTGKYEPKGKWYPVLPALMPNQTHQADFVGPRHLNRITMKTEAELKQSSLGFEHKHNSCYRYSKLRGQTPMQALSGANQALKFPDQNQAPQYPLKKPRRGKYHVVRYLRSDSRLNIFGEMFPVSDELQYEYVVATIVVKEQKLKLFLANDQVDEFNYRLL